MLRLYDCLESGNGYKVRLLLHQLERPFERVEFDILAGQTRTPEFLALNPNGRIPLLQLEANAFFAAGRYTIADITLYADTHVAHEGGFDLSGLPALRAWLERVRAQPGHVPIERG